MIKTLLLIVALQLIRCQVVIKWTKDCPATTKRSSDSLFPYSPFDGEKKFVMDPSIEMECAYPTVPSYWKNPNGRNITFFVRRLKAKNRRGQMWLNDGGPGGGASWVNYGELATKLYQMFNQEMDIIVPSHRGTGHSTHLNCPQELHPNWEQELQNPGKLFEECLNFVKSRYGNSFNAFNPTEAARDIYNVAESLRMSANEKIVIFGVSYGAYLMNRYLQLYPRSNHLVIMDGVAPPLYTQLLTYDENADRQGIESLRECEKDSFCSSRIQDPVNGLRKVFEGFESNHCPEFFKSIKKFELKRSLFLLIASIPNGKMQFIPPLIKRIQRCNSLDKEILKRVASIISPKSEITGGNSFILGLHIGLSELLYNGTKLPTYEELKKKEEKYMFSPAISPANRIRADHWDIMKPDEYHNKFANTRQPLLILNGGLDPQTPWFFATFYYDKIKKNELQHLVKFPNYVHGVLFHSHGNFCAQNIVVEWVKNPMRRPNTDCISTLPRIDWRGVTEESRNFSKMFFGIENMWENL